MTNTNTTIDNALVGRAFARALSAALLSGTATWRGLRFEVAALKDHPIDGASEPVVVVTMRPPPPQRSGCDFVHDRYWNGLDFASYAEAGAVTRLLMATRRDFEGNTLGSACAEAARKLSPLARKLDKERARVSALRRDAQEQWEAARRNIDEPEAAEPGPEDGEPG